MSLRLNKVANIPEVLPTTTGAGWCHFNSSSPRAYIEKDGPMWPFAASSIVGSHFTSYNVPNLSESGAVVNYAGEGGKAFRAGKGDYFLAGMSIDQLFDDYRAATTPILIGITAGIWVMVGSTVPLPNILPMIIWSNTDTFDFGNGVASDCIVHGYSILTPSFENRIVAGKMMTFSKLEQTLAIEKRGFKHVYFAYYIGRPDVSDKTAEYLLAGVGSTLSINSLKGNRPVFDPVMV